MSNSNIGRFTWYDLNTLSVAGGHDFYTQVIGWTLTPFDDDYVMFSAGAPLAGVMELTADAKAMGAPPNWLGYVAVADADDAATKAASLGGRILVPTFEVPKVGRIAIIADPQGAVIGLWQAAEGADAHDSAEAHGEFVWRELVTSDVDDAARFYSALFGWTLADTVDMGPLGLYSMFSPAPGAANTVGMMQKPAEVPVSAWVYYIHVDDLDATLERTRAHGGRVVNGPTPIPGEKRVAVCVDDQGAVFAVHGK